MKCIQHYKTKAIRRVTDDKAKELTKGGNWDYIPKEIWKKAKRQGALQGTQKNPTKIQI